MTWVAVSKDKHRETGLKKDFNLAFAKETTFVPISISEIVKCQRFMPLVFVEEKSGFQFGAVMGVEPNVNIFVDPESRWKASYLPAIFRTHPFRLLETKEEKHILAVYEHEDFITTRANGEPFFDEAGNETNFLKEVGQLITAVARSAKLTKNACNIIAELDLLEPWPLKMDFEGKTYAFQEMHKINEKKLRALSDSDFSKLRQSMGIDIFYAHAFSLQNFEHLLQMSKLNKRFGHVLRQTKDRELELKSLGDEIFGQQLNDELKINFD